MSLEEINQHNFSTAFIFILYAHTHTHVPNMDLNVHMVNLHTIPTIYSIRFIQRQPDDDDVHDFRDARSDYYHISEDFNQFEVDGFKIHPHTKFLRQLLIEQYNEAHTLKVKITFAF